MSKYYPHRQEGIGIDNWGITWSSLPNWGVGAHAVWVVYLMRCVGIAPTKEDFLTRTPLRRGYTFCGAGGVMLYDEFQKDLYNATFPLSIKKYSNYRGNVSPLTARNFFYTRPLR